LRRFVRENSLGRFFLGLFLAVVVVHLRQRGSPESKRVGAPHRKTDVSG
jgi:hypothetical protein